jgi:hypothetical protein
MRTLEVDWGRATYRNTKINFISLVRIPDSQRVHLASDWAHRIFGLLDVRLSEVPRELKDELNMLYGLPELILQERLPRGCLLWTKDYRLLRSEGAVRSNGAVRRRGKGSRGARRRIEWMEAEA